MKYKRKSRASSRIWRRGVVTATVLLAIGGVLIPNPLPSGGTERIPVQRGAPKEARAFLHPPPPLTVLLLGIDSRTGEAARSDTIQVMHLNPETRTVRLLSIPRDTWVSIPGYGHTKINHAMVYGGVPLVQQTVQQFLHIPIDYYAVVDFKGFAQIVDTLGGVDIQVEKQMDYDDPTDNTHIHFHSGWQHVNGQRALDYARFRHDAEADTGRMRRQREIVKAIGHKALDPTQWQNVFQVSSIFHDHVKTNIPGALLGKLALAYYRFDLNRIEGWTMQGQNRVNRKDQLWYFFADTRKIEETVAHLLDNREEGAEEVHTMPDEYDHVE